MSIEGKGRAYLTQLMRAMNAPVVSNQVPMRSEREGTAETPVTPTVATESAETAADDTSDALAIMDAIMLGGEPASASFQPLERSRELTTEEQRQGGPEGVLPNPILAPGDELDSTLTTRASGVVPTPSAPPSPGVARPLGVAPEPPPPRSPGSETASTTRMQPEATPPPPLALGEARSEPETTRLPARAAEGARSEPETTRLPARVAKGARLEPEVSELYRSTPAADGQEDLSPSVAGPAVQMMVRPTEHAATWPDEFESSPAQPSSSSPRAAANEFDSLAGVPQVKVLLDDVFVLYPSTPTTLLEWRQGVADRLDSVTWAALIGSETAPAAPHPEEAPFLYTTGVEAYAVGRASLRANARSLI